MKFISQCDSLVIQDQNSPLSLRINVSGIRGRGLLSISYPMSAKNAKGKSRLCKSKAISDKDFSGIIAYNKTRNEKNKPIPAGDVRLFPGRKIRQEVTGL